MDLPGWNLLVSIAGALIQHAGEVKQGCLPVDVIRLMAATVWQQWPDPSHEIGAELRALAQLPRKSSLTSVVDELSGVHIGCSPGEVDGYLTRVHTLVRSSSWGRAGSRLEGPEDLEPLLPILVAELNRGGRPWPDEDLTLVEPLARGNSSEVWKANAKGTFTERAEDVLAVKFALGLLAVERMRQEAEAVSRLFAHGQPAGIVPLVRNLLDRSPPALAFAFIDGGSLTALIHDMHAQGQPAPAMVARTMHYLARIVSGLHRLLPPLVHGDLKPGNILVQRLPEQRLHLFVTDFGASDGAAFTPPYASPNQVQGLPLTPSDDVHALGVIWLQMQTGSTVVECEERMRSDLDGRGVPGPLVDLLARSGVFPQRQTPCLRPPQRYGSGVECRSAPWPTHRPNERTRPGSPLV